MLGSGGASSREKTRCGEHKNRPSEQKSLCHVESELGRGSRVYQENWEGSIIRRCSRIIIRIEKKTCQGLTHIRDGVIDFRLYIFLTPICCKFDKNLFLLIRF